ncbi:MAG: transposase [Firmicutes bacterium]|nr:transposase [Bacillota bacterium]
MNAELQRWYQLLAPFRRVFTAPGADRFIELLTAWVLCPGRRTGTRLWQMVAGADRPRYEAYVAFCREGRWPKRADLLRVWAHLLVDHLSPRQLQAAHELWLLLDDTLFHKTGRKVEGAGRFRDAVRSGVKTVTAWGLNIVVLAVYVEPLWGREPWAIPINLRIHRKPKHENDPKVTLLDLAATMVREVAEWFPDYQFTLMADGAYASLAKRHLPRTALYSRMRRNAALYTEAPARQPGQRGRPRKKGTRLATPEHWAATLPTASWQSASVTIRGQQRTRLVSVHRVLWYETCPDQLVLMVLVRDPSGQQPDDFFFTTDLTATAVAVLEHYGGRWTIEETFRAVKQQLRGETPQSWARFGPERTVMLAFLTYGLVWLWYQLTQGDHPTFEKQPWYQRKHLPSFLDALASLRTTIWTERILGEAASGAISSKITPEIIRILSEAG